MKRFSGVFVIFVCILSVTSERKDLSDEDLNGICRRQLNLTVEEINDLIEKEVPPTTKIGKCLYACLMTEMGIMDENNKLVPTRADEGHRIMKSGSKVFIMIQIGEHITPMCELISDPDRCEAAAKIMSCLVEEGVKYALEELSV